MNKRVALFLALLFLSCNGPFPAVSKPELPEDHTESIKGVFHKKGYKFPYKSSSGCSDANCHHDDLDGGVAEVDGRITISPSCFQCHETLWSDEGDQVYFSAVFLSSMSIKKQEKPKCEKSF